jgi:hypothetical protein
LKFYIKRIIVVGLAAIAYPIFMGYEYGRHQAGIPPLADENPTAHA